MATPHRRPLPRSKAIAYLLLTALLWSTSGVLIKIVDWNPFGIAGVRSAIAAVVMLAVIRRPHWTWSRAQILGACSYAASVTLFVLAMKWTTAANAILLQYTAPVYVAVLGPWLLGERASFWDWIAIAVTLVGMSLFFMDALTATGFWGNVAALVSGVFFAGLILSLRYQKAGSPLESGLLGNVFVATLAVPSLALSPPPADSWLPLVLLGVFQLGIAHLLYATALRSVAAIEAAIIPMIEPILSPLWVFLAIGERPGPFALIGGSLVLGTVAIRGIFGLIAVSPTRTAIPRPSRLEAEHPGP